jgi:hypothetical protein
MIKRIKEFFKKLKEEVELKKLEYEEKHKPIFYKDYDINKLSNYRPKIFEDIKLLIDNNRIDIIKYLNSHDIDLIEVKIIDHGECIHCHNKKIQIKYIIAELCSDGYVSLYEFDNKYTKIYCNGCGSIFEK